MTSRWYAFRLNKSEPTNIYAKEDGTEVEINCVISVPEGEEPSEDSPTVQEYVGRGFKYLGVVTQWVRVSQLSKKETRPLSPFRRFPTGME